MSINPCVEKPEEAIVISEQDNPQPTDHVFALQLQESHGHRATCCAARAENLSSGEATRFDTTTELCDFVDNVPTEETDHRGQLE